ncbi:DUF6170 family protein [Alteromonas sp. ASW11-130]|uniref:DUF6170 family protein n=1 Tax=Alteromonas sp. ASW11-130 TaxID=3015775 RepID=UPI002241DB35|nr:DUF6170 family protein [Alteromonas sp. ASW11-130]MCW8092835.1 DUF6170 family protein [Alteromonas sp. ASW11-130]
MAFYFTTKHIPALQGLSLSERMARLEVAAKSLTVPEKTLLNVLKLLVICPAFALVLRTAQDWTSLLWAAAIILLYPLLVKPIQYSLSAKYLITNPSTKESQ